jgi:hypothetical protein
LFENGRASARILCRYFFPFSFDLRSAKIKGVPFGTPSSLLNSFQVEQFLGCVLALAIGFNVPVFAFDIVSGVAHSVFYFSHSISCLTLGLFHSTLRLGAAVAGPFAHLALGAPGNVFRFSLNTILVHEFILPFVALMFICNVCLDNRSSSRDQLENQCDQSQHKQNMNKTTHGVAADYSQQP